MGISTYVYMYVHYEYEYVYVYTYAYMSAAVANPIRSLGLRERRAASTTCPINARLIRPMLAIREYEYVFVYVWVWVWVWVWVMGIHI